MDIIHYKPIGIIHSPFTGKEKMPIQPIGAIGIKGTVEMHLDYIEGLKDIEEFSHIILLYHFHLSKGFSLKVKPFLDNKLHGIFSTRAPRRPNQIGLSIVKLIRVENNILHIENVDIIDGTPLLDIKPYVPAFDIHEVEKIGWLTDALDKTKGFRSNGRFKNET